MDSNNSRRVDQINMLDQALQQQRRTVRCFELMQAAAVNRDEKLALSAMQREDRRHYYLLEGIFEELSGNAYKQAKVAIAMPRST